MDCSSPSTTQCATTDWKAQKTLQAYTYDTYERDRLTDVLIRRVADPEVAEAALQVFFHFQRPELIQTKTQPADEIVFPVVVLVQVLRDRLALPWTSLTVSRTPSGC